MATSEDRAAIGSMVAKLRELSQRHPSLPELRSAQAILSNVHYNWPAREDTPSSDGE